MNDPHVEWLRYRIELRPTLRVTDPSLRDYEADGHTLQLEAGKLTVSMKEHHASVESAQEQVEPLLRSWERDTDLTYGSLALRFIHENSKVIDRDPPPPGAPQKFILQPRSGRLVIGGSANTMFVVGLREYPPPPVTFRTTPDVEALWYHYQSHLAGKERLADMGYYCFTLLKGLGGGTKGAATMFQIGAPVLRKLSELTSLRGDMKSARKFMRRPHPYDPQEETWIVEVVKVLGGWVSMLQTHPSESSR